MEKLQEHHTELLRMLQYEFLQHCDPPTILYGEIHHCYWILRKQEDLSIQKHFLKKQKTKTKKLKGYPKGDKKHRTRMLKAPATSSLSCCPCMYVHST